MLMKCALRSTAKLFVLAYVANVASVANNLGSHSSEYSMLYCRHGQKTFDKTHVELHMFSSFKFPFSGMRTSRPLSRREHKD